MSADLVVSRLAKRFGRLEALKPLDVRFEPGVIHAVVGENGAGKSTLMNLLAGFVKPSEGSIQFDGTDIQNLDSQARRRLGIEMVHQHFKLVPAFTLRQNFRLSQLGLGNLDHDLPERTAASLGWEIPWESKTDDVSVGVEQRVEILKALANDAKVVIFDEPTAVLSEAEAAQLFVVLRKLADAGKIVILIAHKISEILACADIVTVLRRGEHIGTLSTSEVTAEKLIEMMLGSAVETRSKQDTKSGNVMLSCKKLNISVGERHIVSGVDYDFRAGCIVGIGGVDGNGQLEFSEALADLRKHEGHIERHGSVGYIPQDRQQDGLAVELDLIDNLALQQAKQSPWFDRKKHAARAQNLIEKYNVKALSPTDLGRQLSGGNQQKAVVARVLEENPAIVIAVNPTRGLDVKASEFVRSELVRQARRGAAVILFSTDRDELADICDEIVYMSSGKLYPTEEEALAS